MFKALNKRTDQEIIILAPEWIDQIDHLRTLGRQDILVCQECKQPVRVRAGEIRIQHFAHKHQQDCPYGHESPTLLKAKMILYKWLCSKFGAGVTLEKRLEGDLPRYVDCWVGVESCSFAYWIIESGMRLQKRKTIKEGLTQAQASVNWVFVADILNEDENDSNRVHLSTTEREFMQQSVYDEMTQGWRLGVGESLHYLDPDSETLITFRNLHLIHGPQMYEGTKKESEISSVLVSPKTGEFVHPGEHEALQEYEKRKREREKEQRKQADALQRHRYTRNALVQSSPLVPYEPLQKSGLGDVQQYTQEENSVSPSPVKLEATCRICGARTSDWVVHYAANNTCECRECAYKEKSD